MTSSSPETAVTDEPFMSELERGWKLFPLEYKRSGSLTHAISFGWHIARSGGFKRIAPWRKRILSSSGQRFAAFFA